jgi:hypothetical protein
MKERPSCALNRHLMRHLRLLMEGTGDQVGLAGDVGAGAAAVFFAESGAKAARLLGLYLDDDEPGCGDADFTRASGDCRCEKCGRVYYAHPYCSRSWSSWAETYTLHVLCDGRHVKL